MGPHLEEIAAHPGVSISTLKRTAQPGRALTKLSIVLAFVGACGGTHHPGDRGAQRREASGTFRISARRFTSRAQ
ncbi:hypothetical protein ACIQ7Q_34255 [Streptomyces sp. NPDC096176]|uniref:hypothetical protein n=1 Tax=Streptomyces sp. NPDC096176 TaxID=3366079 RepID=UPI00382CA970